HHIDDHVLNPILNSSLAWIEPLEFPVGSHPLRMGVAEIVRSRGTFRGGMPYAIWIEPCMQFQTAQVRFPNRELEGIPIRLRSFSLRAAQPFRPRLKRRAIQRIAHGPHLQDHRVEMQLLRAIENINERLLLL